MKSFHLKSLSQISLRPPVIIIQAQDVILAEIVATLNLDEDDPWQPKAQKWAISIYYL